VNEQCAVPVKDLGGYSRPIAFESSYIRKVGKGPDDPDDKEEYDEHKGADGCKEGLLHGAGLLLPVLGVLVRLIPSTDGTGVDASAPAAAPERADYKNESETNENVDELIIGQSDHPRTLLNVMKMC
jgi:hypothetical protein